MVVGVLFMMTAYHWHFWIIMNFTNETKMRIILESQLSFPTSLNLNKLNGDYDFLFD